MSANEFNAARRKWLQSTAMLGFSALAPTTLLSACGGSSDDTGGAPPDRGMRETRTLHFDLSHAPSSNPKLRLANSNHHGTTLVEHTADTRASARAQSPSLAGVPDQNLTHFLSDVDLPANALQFGGVDAQDPKTGAALLALNFLHVPRSSLDVVAKRRAATPLVAHEPPGLLRAPALLGATPIPCQPGFSSAPWDVAVWLVFQNPSITNLNPDLGGDIIDRINNLPDANNPYLSELAFQVATLLTKGGYPTTSDTGSWAILVPVVDKSTGLPVLDGAGTQIYRYTINPALSATTATIVKQILNDIVNDPLFSGTNWQPANGAPPVLTQVAQASAMALAPPALGTSSVFSVQHSARVGSRTSGIRFKNVTCADDRSVQITVANEYLRSAGVFVQYFDANGAALPVDSPNSMDTPRAKWLTVLAPDIQIMGVPLLGELTPTSDFSFTMPPSATTAKLYYGGLGLGGSDAFHGEALLGTVMTLVLNLGLPSICLVAGIASVFNKGLEDAISEAIEDPITLQLILTEVAKALGSGLGSSIQTATTTMSMQAFLGGIAETVLDIFLGCCPRLGELLAAAIGGTFVELAIPLLGTALWALSTLADMATIAETVAEVLSSSAIDTSTISLSMATTVQISRDPNDFQFPATAQKYKVTANFGSGIPPTTFNGTVSMGQVDPIKVVLSNQPSGGNVTVDVSFYSASDCLVGYGVSATVANLPATAALIPITIKEMLVPLDAATSYLHQSKLAYQNGARAWQATTTAPTQTRAALQPGTDNALVALHGITVHTATGNAAYGFNAGGQGINLCSGGAAASLSSIENVFLGTNPQSRLMFSTCGSGQPIGVVYDPHGRVEGGNNFFLQGGSDGFYHLRGINLDAANFDMNQSLSWGRFMSPLDSMCVLSSGYVIGVNRSTHKMEVLRLAQSPSTPTDETDSVPFSALKSGYGSLPGRLDTPVAVASYDTNVLVLEQGNLRVQAFDQDGNTQAIFTDAGGNPTPIMALRDTSGVTYLDLGVEGMGYVYVLSYANDGQSPNDYRLDLYSPAGAFLSRTLGVAAAALAVDLFRNVYTLNYETLAGSPRVEPSLSQWLPSSAAAA